MEDYRSIPVEVLRDFARVQAEITSIRRAADEVGLSHSAFHNFALGRTAPQPRVRRLLGLWYLRKQKELPGIDLIRPYTAALTILLSAVPEPYRANAETETVGALCSIYEECGVPRPAWLDVLAQQASPHWLERVHQP